VFEPGEMSVKSSICLGDELPVKSLFGYTRLIARQQQNGAALRIKGEGYAPYAISGLKSQVLSYLRGVSRPTCQPGAVPAAARIVVTNASAPEFRSAHPGADR